MVDDAFDEVVVRALEDLGDVDGARVLVRMELGELGSVMPPHEDFRLLGTLSTIDWLQERGAAVAVCSTVPGQDSLRPTV